MAQSAERQKKPQNACLLDRENAEKLGWKKKSCQNAPPSTCPHASPYDIPFKNRQIDRK